MSGVRWTPEAEFLALPESVPSSLEGLSRAEVVDTVLTSALLPGFSLDLARLFTDRP